MKKQPNYVLWGVVAVAVILILWFVGAYNGLIRSDENVNEKWANVETQYQRRADLIPNLVDTVQQYTDYEGELLTEVTEARTAWMQARQGGSVDAQVAAAQSMDSALSRLLVTVEAYPNLKANENYLSLQDELAGTENRVGYARQEFNAAVRDFNTKVRRFPTNIVADMFGFERKTPFEAEEGAQNAPDVGGLFNA